MIPNRKPPTMVVVVVTAILATGWGIFFRSGAATRSEDSLVVYCAHDAAFSEPILRRFERETGIPIVIRHDTEATKSLGLVNLLMAEKKHPRCDVFWNNQVLGTIALKEKNMLAEHRGVGYERIPDRFKDPDGTWVGFAARMRVYIVNTDNMAADDDSVQQMLQGDLSRMAMAKPLFGTTLSHYSLLWHLWGGERLKCWHDDVRLRGVREVAGNAMVKNLVAEGVCDFGWTDTDDYFVAQDAGFPVAMVPIRVHGHATICLPNSVAIIKGTNKLQHAQRLVDYLLSERIELELAASQSRQIPLGPVDEQKLSADVRQLTEWAKSGYDVTSLGGARRECLNWLESEYLR